jgi:hypothetical protein
MHSPNYKSTNALTIMLGMTIKNIMKISFRIKHNKIKQQNYALPYNCMYIGIKCTELVPDFEAHYFVTIAKSMSKLFELVGLSF